MAGSSYLKAMQLRKQLEEKAKEATRKRQEAEEILSTAEERLKKAPKADLDVSKAKDLIAKANASMADKDYDTALVLANECVSELDKAYGDVVKTISDATRKLGTLLKDTGADTALIERHLKKAEEAIASGRAEDALTSTKEGWELAEKGIHERLSAQFSSAQSLILVARKHEEDVVVAEDLMSRARSALESQDYEAAFKHIRECIESVGGTLGAEVDDALDDARTMRQQAKELGADVSRVEELIGRAEGEATTYDFERAINSAALARSEAEKALARGISDKIDKLNMGVAEAQAIEADTKITVEHLNRARQALKNGNLDEAASIANAAEEELKNAQFQCVLSTISLSRTKFLTATKLGVDIAGAIEHLNSAREALKAGRFKEALEYARKSDDVVDLLVRDYEEAEETIASLEQALADAMAIGVDTNKASKCHQEAKEALGSRNFSQVSILVHKGLSEIEGDLYKHAMEHLEVGELVVSTGDRIGAPMAEPRRTLLEASKVLREKRFKEAAGLADQAAAKAEVEIRGHVNSFLMTADLAISQADVADISSASELLSRAREAFDKSAYDTAYDLASQAFSIVDMGRSRHARELLAQADTEMRTAQEMGCSVGELSELWNEANVAFSRKDYDKATEISQRVIDAVRPLQYGAAEKVFSHAKVLAVEAKKIGIDITDIRETLKRAKGAFDAGRMKETYDLSEGAASAASRLIEQRNRAYELITQTAAHIAEAKKSKADVEQVMVILLDAKNAFERFDYHKAIELAERAKAETTALINLYHAANKLMAVREHVKLLQELNEEEAKSAAQQTENVKTMLKAKDYGIALSVVEKLEKDVEAALTHGIAALISEAEVNIESAKALGIKVPEGSVAKAREYIAARAYSEAVEAIKSAKEEVEKIRDLSQSAARIVKEAHERVSECESMRAECGEAIRLLEQAMVAIKSSSYAEAIELGEKVIETAKSSQVKYVADTIKEFKLAIEKARMEGVNVLAAERLIDEAKRAMDDGKLKKALEYAMRSEGELEKVGLQQEMASKAIATAEDKVADAKARGAFSKSAEELLRTAQELLRSGDYVKALELAVRSGDELHRAREEYEEAAEALKRAEEMAAVAKNIGGGTPTERTIAAAREALARYEYKIAMERAVDALAEAKQAAYSRASNMLVSAHNIVNAAARIGLKVGEAQQRVTEAKSFLDNSRFERAHEAAERAIEISENLMRAHVTGILEEVNAEILSAAKLGGETSEAEGLVSQAKAALDAAAYEKALDLAERTRAAIVVPTEVDVEFVELTQSAQAAISKAKKFGLSMKEAERLLSLGLAVEERDKAEAVSLVRQAREAAEGALSELKPLLALELSLSDVPKKSEWCSGKIKVTNSGMTFGKDVKVEVMGAADIEGKLQTDMLRGSGGMIELPVKLRFHEEGEVPLVLKASAVRALDGEVFRSERTQQVVVLSDLKAEGPVKKWSIGAAERPGKCSVCMGSVKVGMKVVICSCGRVMH
ncbi:MAG: hypothetical protein AB1665_07850, partial [Candidatus Thermoplasmatota archaeon]